MRVKRGRRVAGGFGADFVNTLHRPVEPFPGLVGVAQSLVRHRQDQPVCGVGFPVALDRPVQLLDRPVELAGAVVGKSQRVDVVRRGLGLDGPFG